MQSDSYKTLLIPSNGQYKEKGSKFLAFAWEINNEDEIKIHLDTIKKEYFDARHHCYAWALGPNRKTFRSFDDGEPSGTAGKPILGQLHSFNLTNTLIIVVRYFGGTLLGTGGLIQAYKQAAANAIENATIIEKTFDQTLEIEFNYLTMNEVMKILKDYNLKPHKQVFENNCSIEVAIRINLSAEICLKLNKIEGTKVSLY